MNMVPVDILEVAMQTKQKKRINYGHSLNRIYNTPYDKWLSNMMLHSMSYVPEDMTSYNKKKKHKILVNPIIHIIKKKNNAKNNKMIITRYRVISRTSNL